MTRTVKRSSHPPAQATTCDHDNGALTAVRSLALAIVVLWHWVFATVRWDGDGPHSGNPLHLVPGAFVLTWFLQVMPVFFIVGGHASKGSLERHRRRGGSDRSWVTTRMRRLAGPALPLAVGLAVAKLTLSPWLFGVVLLAVSPLWFLGVYLPLTALTPILIRFHRRSAPVTFAATALAVAATQYARFGLHLHSPVVSGLALLTVWGLIYQTGLHFDRLRSERTTACALMVCGLVGITLCTAAGLPASMVAVRGEPVSNMGPPTAAIAMLGLLQAGLVALTADRFRRLASKPRIGPLIEWIDANQMTIYIVHLPLWVAQLLVLRFTILGLAGTPTPGWLVTRPLWLIGPGYVLIRLLSGMRLVPQPREGSAPVGSGR